MTTSNNKNPAEDVSKTGATGSSVADDAAYQELQAMYLKWHDGRRPLSGFVNELKEHTAAAVQAAYEKGYEVQLRNDNKFIKYVQAEARINELTRLDNAYDAVTPDNFHDYYIKRIAQLQADAGRSGEES